MIQPQQTNHAGIKPIWHHSLGVMESIVAYNCRVHGFPRPTVAMPFWERAGNMAFDYSGGGHHGELVNGVEWLRNGIYLDGTNYVEIPHSTELNAEYNVSVFASLAKDVGPAWGNIFSKGTRLHWENDNYSLGLEGTTTWFYNDEKGADTGNTLSELVYHTVAVVADSDNALLSTYIDDALAGSSARTVGAATTNSNVMRIGTLTHSLSSTRV